jgi:hypothetical protein
VLHLAILTCPGCGRGGLRVPDGRRGKVTCPYCDAKWFHPATIELSEVEFRCAGSGARFVVQMSRRSPDHKFVIQSIKEAPLRRRKAVEPKRGSDSNIIHASPGASAPHLPPAKSRNWLEKLFKPIGVPDSRSSAADTSDPIVHSTVGAVQHDATEYNWASFFCPYCQKASSFIQCSGGHLACDGTVEIRNGRRFHQCYCGGAGFIEGAIKTIEANHHTFTVEPKPSASSVKDCASGERTTDLAKTSAKQTLSASETPKLPLSSPAPRSRNQH